MDKNVLFINEQKIKRTIKNLENNNMNGYLLANKEDLINKISELVPQSSLVSCGGSMSLFETGVIDYIRNNNYTFLDRYQDGLTKEQMKDIFRQSFLADVYFTSTNAITENGELYNVDGNGNRVAAMLYGPDKVIVVCGVNKIVKNVEDAINRNKYIAAPANAKRLNTDTPCRFTGECMDCNSPNRICGEYTLIKKQINPNRIHVLFLNEEIGY